MEEAILNLVSDRAYEIHKEHLNQLFLKYSILEKSAPCLCGKKIYEIPRARINTELKREAITLLANIEAHKLYFASFANGICKCERLKKYGSESSFLYNTFLKCRKVECGFCFIMSGGDEVVPLITSSPEKAFLDKVYKPILAIDLFEHAYFLDYKFEREEYIKKAMTYLNLSLLN